MKPGALDFCCPARILGKVFEVRRSSAVKPAIVADDQPDCGELREEDGRHSAWRYYVTSPAVTSQPRFLPAGS
ncbi:hypothetical protein PoB_005776200 [Plakobranchus ocellatus]|uniref:Uncharacterized protein n=1 Tax=Plakobranchus ocellatus TaxID=259542 RepID=A0AAV4CI04_9GAST|nr:hypothetical protein PoB_005776200 [Plakobranchus ocellatus]